ncbi:hypothetical protein P280DRAFT_547998 [Massarina eburnea CBS 473.64]|uniref:Heterokaryon incompatibility domain-containing protein n=1 Tax=Massarina eburnea CBS 473.64 TaxID=1395130 RepID=A0A6A6S805_9PLEO|nr:hypothetical protein P280DRAFT_547998 [Massarina eburnea CBS 473.64]
MSNVGIYQDLIEGQIRLLRIASVSDRDPDCLAQDASEMVRCSLEVVWLKDHPKFIALSYTWGSPINSQQLDGPAKDIVQDAHILCNGRRMSIRRNLYDFLLHCSQTTDNDALRGPLWIDAIVIDQTNLSERSYQVNIMGDIYKAAIRVAVWLGKEGPSTPKAFALIEALANATADERSRIHSYQVSHNNPNTLLDLDSWQALVRFFERSWFGRVWIIQEVAFARDITVLCGNKSLQWDDLVETSRYFATSSWSNYFSDQSVFPNSTVVRSHHVPARLAATKKTWASGERDGLLYALLRARHSSSQDLRDKVYSQLSLGNASIFPSYKRTVAEVYITTAKYILEHSENLFLLTCVEGETFQEVPGLPSWVPDWSCTEFLGLRVTGYHAFTASGDRIRNFGLKMLEGKDILSVEAIKIDDIAEIGDTKGEIYEFASPDRLWGLVSRLDETYFTGESREEALWRTLTTNRESMVLAATTNNYPATKVLEASFRDWVTWKYVVASLSHQQRPSEFPAPTSPSNDILPSEKDIVAALETCKTDPSQLPVLAQKASHFDVHYLHAMLTRPFRTKQSFFGLGTQALRPGDSVWIVSGCRVPLVLRKIENSFRFRLVGGAYLHGFMNGEALKRDGLMFEMVELE